MNGVEQLQITQFLLIYLLLVVVGLVMKKCGINEIKRLVVSSGRMTVQLVLAGFILMYIFENPNPLFIVIYISAMIGFSIHRVISKNKQLNVKFKAIVAFSVVFSGVSVLLFFVILVIGQSIFNPQYAIPISGMLLGNTMTALSLGITTFSNSIKGNSNKINAAIYAGAKPEAVLSPFVRQALETAMVPTLNSMVGMGIVSLPGMMTGQILSGTLPLTAILYQIAIIIAICTIVTLSSFISLYFGQKTLIDKKLKTIKV